MYSIYVYLALVCTHFIGIAFVSVLPFVTALTLNMSSKTIYYVVLMTHTVREVLKYMFVHADVANNAHVMALKKKINNLKNNLRKCQKTVDSHA